MTYVLISFFRRIGTKRSCDKYTSPRQNNVLGQGKNDVAYNVTFVG